MASPSISVSCCSAITSAWSGSASGPHGKSSGSTRRCLRSRSIRRFRAIVKIQVDTLALPGSNIWALRHKVTMTSCAHSSARSGLAPDFIKNDFTRGPKCANSSAKASVSLLSRTASSCGTQAARFSAFSAFTLLKLPRPVVLCPSVIRCASTAWSGLAEGCAVVNIPYVRMWSQGGSQR